MNDQQRTIGCAEIQDWIWGAQFDTATAPEEFLAHLAACGECRDERAARGALALDLRNLRAELNELPPRDLDHRVLDAAAEAVAARESGQYAPVRPSAPPPLATPRWMTAAAALMGAAVLLGFLAGRFTATGAQGFAGGPGPAVHTTLATAAPQAAIDWRNMHRPHQVGISPDGLSRLQDGRTYLMTGPVGGPYQVVGAVTFEEVELPNVYPRGQLKEIVVAVGPSDGWAPGREIALADLNESGAEILGRRKVEDPPVQVGFTAP